MHSRIGANVKGIEKGKRYCVLAIGGCASCASRARKVKATPPHDNTQDPASEALSTPLYGVGQNGGHAEYTLVDAGTLIPVPDNVPSEFAAVAADAGTTAWHAVHKTAGVSKQTLRLLADYNYLIMSEIGQEGREGTDYWRRRPRYFRSSVLCLPWCRGIRS